MAATRHKVRILARIARRLTALSVVLPVTAAADALLTVKSLECEFSKWVVMEFVGGEMKWPPKQTNNKMTLRFDTIDLKGGKARLSHAAGTGEVAAMTGSAGLTFLDRTPEGNVNLTTVYHLSAGTDSFFAVHSRHSFYSETGQAAVPGQTWGTCAVPGN